MRSGASGRLSNAKIILIWSILLFGAIFQARFGIRDTNILVLFALFDIVLPVVVLWGFGSGWLSTPSTRLMAPTLLCLAAILLHSILVFVFFSDINVLWLLKNTIRLATVITHFLLLLILFQREELRTPPTSILAGFLILAALLGVPIVLFQIFSPSWEFVLQGDWFAGFFQRTSFQSFIQPFYISPTVHAVTLLGVLFLMGSGGEWQHAPRHRIRLAIIALAVAGICLLLSSKASVGVAIIMAAWFVFGDKFKEISPRHLAGFLGSVLCFGAILFLLVWASGYTAELATRIDSLNRSFDIRIQIWRFAIEQAASAFPVGGGFGQFGHLAAQVPLFAAEKHLSPHNSFLTVLFELGLLGVALVIGFLMVLYRAVVAGPSILALPLLLVILMPLTLHDGHTIRIVIVLLALGIARYAYQVDREGA